MSEFEPTLVRAKDGSEATAHTPLELNDLVYGEGYEVVGPAPRDTAPPPEPEQLPAEPGTPEPVQTGEQDQADHDAASDAVGEDTAP